MRFLLVAAFYLISLNHCVWTQEQVDLGSEDFDDYYPQSIKKFSVRKDTYSKEPVTRGRIELVGGLGDKFTFRTTEKRELSDQGALAQKPYKRVHVDELKRLLQCSPREPTIDGSRGSMGLLQIVIPKKETVEHICASIESGCSPLYKCREQADKFRRGGFPTGHGYDGNSNRNLLRVMNDDVYFDWPWGRERLKSDPCMHDLLRTYVQYLVFLAGGLKVLIFVIVLIFRPFNDGASVPSVGQGFWISRQRLYNGCRAGLLRLERALPCPLKLSLLQER